MNQLRLLCFNVILLISITASVQGQGASQDLLGRINGLRSSLGLSPYSLHSALSIAAINHANWMATTGNVTHVQPDGSTPATRASAAGYNSAWVSENIYLAGAIGGLDSAWNFWINSSVHYSGLTSPNFQHIGIADVNGANGHAFVLVFGVPGESRPQAQGGASNNSAAAAPPSFVVGTDEFGNIMHEIQPGDTLGDIALRYGYTWDDIPAMLAANEMSEDDVFDLEIGEVFLVPPAAGTYTPVPEATDEPQPEATDEPQPEATATPTEARIAQAAPLLPTENAEGAEPSANGEVRPEAAATISATAEATTANGLLAPVEFVAPSATATATATTTTATLAPSLVAPVVDFSTTVAQPDDEGVPPLWLLAAVLIQLSVLGFAIFEFIRRMIR